MRVVMVRYTVKPDRVAENERLVRAVYEELSANAPEGFRYGTFKLDDGRSFMHLAAVADGARTRSGRPAPSPSSSARSPSAARRRRSSRRSRGRLLPPPGAWPGSRMNPLVHLELHTGDEPAASAFYEAAAGLAPRADPGGHGQLPDARRGRPGRCRCRRVRRDAAAVAPLCRGRGPRAARPSERGRWARRCCSAHAAVAWQPQRAGDAGRRRDRAVGAVPRPRREVRAMTEQQLLESARTGDEDAFGRLVDPHRNELFAHCYRMLGSPQDAEDALQETLLRAWRGLDGFAGRSSPRSWLYTIATNASLRAIERRPPRVLPLEHGPASDSARRTGRPARGDGVDRTAGRRAARPARRPGLARGPLRAARERRAGVRRGPADAVGAPARRADPARRARLLGARGRRGARRLAVLGRQRPAACAPHPRDAPSRAQPAGRR